MPGSDDVLECKFEFGDTTVQVLQGDILNPGVPLDAVVSTDDNYLTMGSGVSRALRKRAGPDYVREAQDQCPVKAGRVIVSCPHELPSQGLDVKYVLHGTSIDLDTEDQPLEQLVYQTTANCLEKAEELGVRRIAFPAFATRSGNMLMESCARQMCSAIKVYLAQDRPLEAIYVILHLPKDETGPGKGLGRKARNRRFIRQANEVFGVPYSPALGIRHSRDLFVRDAAMEELEAVLTGQVAGKRHAVILGGPQIGKKALLDKLYERARRGDGPLGEGRCFAKVTFGRVHDNTPLSFIYRKFLYALREQEWGTEPEDSKLRAELKAAYADPRVDCKRFLDFLEEHKDRYPKVVFLIDHLPRLLRMEAKEAGKPDDVRDFWKNLDRLQERVHFVYTARDDVYGTLRDERLGPLTESFKHEIAEIRVLCATEDERREWVKGLYRHYLDREPTDYEHDFFEEEAGRHPYLITLAAYELIRALKPEALANPDRQYTKLELDRFKQAARTGMEGPRQAFFDRLMRGSLEEQERLNLKNLAQAAVIEEELPMVMQEMVSKPKALERFKELQAMGNPRMLLHKDALRQLEERGYLVDAGSLSTAQFMAKPFEAYAADSLGVTRYRGEGDRPQDVMISLLSAEEVQDGAGQTRSREGALIKTLFRGRGAKIITADTPLRHRDMFMANFDQHVRHVLHPKDYPEGGDFATLVEVGEFILRHFTTGPIRGYLQDLPEKSTIVLEVDDALKEIPWELMLEAVYAGEIPFRLGRRLVSRQQSSSLNLPVRGDGKVRALLIADPTEKSPLPAARDEVQNLANLLREDGRFIVRDDDDEKDILIGPDECRLLKVEKKLSSGKYGLVHYSGHSEFKEEGSAWVLSDGKLNTHDLTSSLRDAPPALVFSSSCESAEAGKPRPVRYEDQTFDLPSAFLQAGVEAYIGTLWEVEQTAARRFVEAFYRTLLNEGHCLGECLRQAKMAGKTPSDRVNWLAFVLYGDPHVTPGDLFPALS